MMQIEMTGLDKLIKQAKKLGEEKRLQQLQHDLVLGIKRMAKDLCPVKSGQLRATIYMRRLHKYDYEVGFTMYYGIWNEYGSYNIHQGTIENPNLVKSGYSPFLRPAVFRGLRKLPQLFKKYYLIK